MATKTSILIFYLRLARNTQKVLRFASWATLGVVNLAGTVLTFMNIFQCRPIEAAWSPWDRGSTCIPLLTEFICAAPVNIVTDLAILALPIPVLTGMRLPPRQKTILVLTFGLGIFVTIVDVVRIYYLQQAIGEVPTSLSADPETRFGGQQEFSYNASLSFMWCAVEVNVGMTCACIPTLKPLIIKILPAIIIDPDGTGLATNKERDELGNRSSIPVSTSFPSVSRNSRQSVQLPPLARAPNSRAQRGSRASAGFYDLDVELPPSIPGANPVPNVENDRAETLATLTGTTSMNSRQENAVYFGFVNMAKPKSMLRCSVSESWKYCTTVTILFFLWGVSYGLLNTLNNAIAYVAGMSYAQTLGLTSAYFGGGYFFGPLLVGEWILRRDEHHRRPSKKQRGEEGIGGFKVTFIVGLCFYGIGTIIFWPSAVTKSFGGFMLSNFVVGFGLSILETGANAFLILCGPEKYADTRLMLAQGVQGIGSVLSSVLAQRVFFSGIHPGREINSLTLINVQWTYLAITLVCVVLALFFYYMPLPEVSDYELDRASKTLPADPQQRSIGGLQLRTVTLILAVVAQWTYMAAQEGASIYFRRLVLSLTPERAGEVVDAPHDFSSNVDTPSGLNIAISDYLLVAQSTFAASRFVVAAIIYWSLSNPRVPKPRTILGVCVSLSSLFALLAVVVHPANGNLAAVPIILLYTTEGPCWPLIFSIGLRGQGRRTKRAAAFITMGGSGPAFFPFVMYAIIEGGGTVQLAFVVVAVLQFTTGVYPLFLLISGGAKGIVDPVIESGSGGKDVVGMEGGHGVEVGMEEGETVEEMIRKRRKRGSSGAGVPAMIDEVEGGEGEVSASGSGTEDTEGSRRAREKAGSAQGDL